MYGTVSIRGSILWYLRYNFLFSRAQMFLSSVHPYVSAGYAILSAIFAHGALSMLWYSTQRRHLCFGPTPSATPPITKMTSVIQSVFQTAQAFQSSRSLSSVFVNQSYGVLIFLNCFVCVALPGFFRDNMAKGRLVCVLTDLTLDFVWGTIIPLVVFWPYLRMFYDYQHEVNAPTAVEDVQKEVEFILVMPLSDFILSTFPFMSSAANLQGVKKLLNNYDNRLGALYTASENDGSSRGAWKWVGRIFQGLFLLYGVAILGISVSSKVSTAGSAASAVFPCLHRVHPWLSTKEACAGRVIDCAAANMDGSLEEITAAVNLFDESTLTDLVFDHCPSLEIASAIHRFKHLSILAIRDSRVHRWGVDTAVSDNVDIAAFENRIGDNWSKLKYLYCDNCNYVWFPATVRTMRGLLELSLMYNDISSIDDRDVEQLASLENLWLDKLPVTSLPDALWSMCSHLNEFSLQNTSVASIPDWVAELASKNLRLRAFGTPLCADASLVAKHRQFLWCEEVVY
ncbi:hypothetical protein PybrP1_000109 [[Pythium] brassicae (nom. inval.)]|nr:hypothetical protein PybrP1_000109 [[Pythium] brassicae (nom. inval.)]